MWIIPKCLTTSHSVMDTEELTSGFIESLAKESAPCLLVRSKPLQSKMLLQKWKRGEFLRVRYGLIYARFLGHSFLEKWTSSLADFRANHLAVPESEVETKTQDTCSHTSSVESKSANQALCSLKMSRELYQPNLLEMGGETQPERRFCSMSSANWSAWVTAQRQAYSARVKSARRTSESGCSSWPTISVNESKNCTGGSQWERNSIPLGTAVTDGGRCLLRQMEHANAEKMDAEEIAGANSHVQYADAITASVTAQDQHKTDTSTKKSTGSCTRIRLSQTSIAIPMEDCSGQPDQANHSTNGSRQGWWTPQVQDSKHSGTNPSSNGKRDLLVNQVGQMQKDWRTPGASDGEGGVMEMREGCAGKYKLRDHVVAEAKQWSTPRAGATDNSRPNNKGGIPLGDQARREQNVEVEAKATGKLSSRWVETLMGVPIGWVSPDPVTHTTFTNRTDELRLLGNGVVPATAYKAWTTLTGELK